MNSQADKLEVLDNEIWDAKGYEDGGDVRKDWTNYVAEVAKVVKSPVSKKVIDYLTEDNYHSLVEALTELKLVK